MFRRHDEQYTCCQTVRNVEIDSSLLQSGKQGPRTLEIGLKLNLGKGRRIANYRGNVTQCAWGMCSREL